MANEREWLQKVIDNPQASIAVRVEAVLVLHTRQEPEGCFCGWSELGGSFAKHQREILQAAGLLREKA